MMLQCVFTSVLYGVSAELHVPPALPLRKGPGYDLGLYVDVIALLDAVGKNLVPARY
jgi:hypothetical protein